MRSRRARPVATTGEGSLDHFHADRMVRPSEDLGIIDRRLASRSWPFCNPFPLLSPSLSLSLSLSLFLFTFMFLFLFCTAGYLVSSSFHLVFSFLPLSLSLSLSPSLSHGRPSCLILLSVSLACTRELSLSLSLSLPNLSRTAIASAKTAGCAGSVLAIAPNRATAPSKSPPICSSARSPPAAARDGDSKRLQTVLARRMYPSTTHTSLQDDVKRARPARAAREEGDDASW